MKTKMMKRAAAFAASVLMTAAMAMPVAAFDTPNSGVNVPFVTNDSELSLNKDIYVFNTSGATIYEPNVTYTYEITPGSANKTIKGKTLVIEEPDTPTVTVSTKAGDGVKLNGNAWSGGKGTAVLVFGDDAAPATATTKEGTTRSAKITEALAITTNPGAFEKAGVYRYQITQTKGGDCPDAVISGTTDGDEDIDIIYLDVYVKQGADGLEVYGLVLSKTDDNIEYKEGSTEENKIDALDPDEYHTVNAEVKKVIEGDLADKEHKFPFEIKGTAMDKSEFYYDTADAHHKLTGDDYTVPVTELGNDDKVTVYGIPAEGTPTLTATETNDTDDVYSVEVKKNGDVVVAQNEIAAKTGTQDYVDNIAITGGVEIDEILFTNTLEAISPTGVLFRIAPYALMMTAGGVLIAVYLRGKKREDAESMI